MKSNPTTPTPENQTSSATQLIARHVRRRSQVSGLPSTLIGEVASTTTTAAPTTTNTSQPLQFDSSRASKSSSPLPAVPTPLSKIGWLGKVGRINTTVRLRFFRLDDDYLSYYRNGVDRKPRGRIDLSTIVALRRSLNPTAPELSLEIVTHKFFRGEQSDAKDRRTYTIVASAPDDLTSWLDALQQHPSVPRSVVARDENDVEEDENGNSSSSNNSSSASLSSLAQYRGLQNETIGDLSFSSGWMIKLGARRNTFRRRFFILADNGELSYYKSELQTRKAIGVIHLNTVLAVRDSGKNTFSIAFYYVRYLLTDIY
jgi:hypothetical protein